MFKIICNFFSQMTKITQTVITRHYCDGECSICSPLVPLNDMKRFIADCFERLGASEYNSEILANTLVEADYRGVFSHGVSQLENFMEDIQNKTCDPSADPTILNEFPCAAVINGNNGFGPVTAKFAMDIAMEKALNNGIAMVAAKGSNYYGMASLHALQAEEKGFIGLSFSNGRPLMVPPGGAQAALGTNPIALAAPAHSDSLVVDIATTAVTLPKIEQYIKNKKNLPEGWALNERGELEGDPEEALKHSMLAPLGADQNHKGFGLALLVETLTALLADSSYGPRVPVSRGKSKKVPPNLGHSFIAINPEKFVPNFATRLSKMLKDIRNIRMAECSQQQQHQILLPGDKERMYMRRADREGGICYSKKQLDKLEMFAKQLGVRPLIISQMIKHKKG